MEGPSDSSSSVMLRFCSKLLLQEGGSLYEDNVDGVTPVAFKLLLLKVKASKFGNFAFQIYL